MLLVLKKKSALFYMNTQVVESSVTHLNDQDNFLLTEKHISVDCIKIG